jgi:hypothetical protein
MPLTTPTTTPTELDCAYLAGIIDGEGSIMAYLHREQRSGRIDYAWHVLVTVGNTDRRLIDWIGNRWLGYYSVTSRARYDQKDMHVWTATGLRMKPVLLSAAPYLVAKTGQAELAFDFLDARPPNPGRRGYTEAERAELDRICARMGELNRKGTRPRGRAGHERNYRSAGHQPRPAALRGVRPV